VGCVGGLWRRYKRASCCSVKMEAEAEAEVGEGVEV